MRHVGLPNRRSLGAAALAAAGTNLRVLEGSPAMRDLDLVSELFHRINRIIPEDQQVLSIAPTCRVRDAVALMREHRYSQIPVVDEESGEVLGVFSYRSFAREAAEATLSDWNGQKCAPGDLQVDELLEPFEFYRFTDEMSRVFEALERDDGVLIGTPERLSGILQPDGRPPLPRSSCRPFVMIWEIELALRALITIALTDEQVVAAAHRCLSSKYGGENRVPTRLEDMTIDNYQALIGHGDTWNSFAPVFGASRLRTTAKIKEIGAIRNALFHFKRDISVAEHQTLTGHRNWLLAKVKQAQRHGQLETTS